MSVDLAKEILQKNKAIVFNYTNIKDRLCFVDKKKIHFVWLQFVESLAAQSNVVREDHRYGIEIKKTN